YLRKDFAHLPNAPRGADAIIERIPQQVLSLMREDQPHYTIYAFGQALKPATGSLITKPGPAYGLCTNYQVTGEYASKTVVSLEQRSNTTLPARVERYDVLQPQ